MHRHHRDGLEPVSGRQGRRRVVFRLPKLETTEHPRDHRALGRHGCDSSDSVRAVEDLPERTDLGYLLARASQRWDALLAERCKAHGFPEVRPAFGSILLPLFQEDGLRMGDLADRARIAKQSMTTLVRDAETAGLVTREIDPEDGRSYRVRLAPRAEEYRPVARLILDEMRERLLEENDPSTVDVLVRSLGTIKELPLDQDP